jgi:hypothetical protein
LFTHWDNVHAQARLLGALGPNGSRDSSDAAWRSAFFSFLSDAALERWVAGTVKALHRYDGSSAAGNSVMMYGSGIQG